MTILTLIRHAESRPRSTARGGPKGDTGLTDRGRRQAEALRDRLLNIGFDVDVVLTSVLPRAIETAAILAPVFGSAEASEDCDVCEMHPGEADGLTWTEYIDRYGIVWPRPPDEPFAPGGESLLELRRAGRLTSSRHHGRLPDEKRGGHARRVHQCGLLASPRAQHGRRAPFFLGPENTSLTTWSTCDDARNPWRLDRYNDAAHLEGLQRSVMMCR